MKVGDGRSDFYCDRCGKKFVTRLRGEASDPTDSSVKNGICAVAPVVVDGSVSFLKKHLCGSCTIKLDKWFRGGKK